MKKIAFILSVMAIAACSNEVSYQGTENVGTENVENVPEGGLTVKIEFEKSGTKVLTDYSDALDEENAEKSVDVFVFDKATGKLNASRKLEAVSEDCSFSVTAGEKIVWVLVNFKNIGAVTTTEQLEHAVSDLSAADMLQDGFAMSGKAGCEVIAGETAAPVITVKRLVARVVLQKVTSDIPEQYGAMTVDCAFLGNANSVQTVSGNVSGMVNADGYADDSKTRPIGQNSVAGSCPDYMYRNVGKSIAVGMSSFEKYHLYCHPNESSGYTCLYLLATIGGNRYYYRVPLNNGLI
ncbi:MAG: hypothetical protein IIV88_01315, partial [Erysipelotrichaceae bacterium]|nr:hypothetical protein [Erysipelotrichaceae bacterium]